MKKLLSLSILFFAMHCFAQVKTSFIHPRTIEVATNKTTNLVFPFSIAHVDRGSKDVLAQQVNEAGNVLELKAAIDSFVETNISVITSDGSLYSFNVQYAAIPKQLNIVLQKEKYKPFVQTNNNEEKLQAAVTAIAKLRRSFFGLADRHDEVHVILKGLYVQNDVLYFRLQVLNFSNVSCDLDALHFIIKDKQKGKRTATQEQPLQPVYITGIHQGIGANAKQDIIIALPKFTLPDNKFLLINISEKNGGRDLSLHVKDRHLIRAKILRDAY